MDKTDKSKSAANLGDIVEDKAVRKIKAQRQKDKNIWFGFTVFGLIGWSVAVPTLLGAALGFWLDENHPRQQSWTLTLLLAGLVLGCFTAWRWVEKERKSIRAEEDDND